MLFLTPPALVQPPAPSPKLADQLAEALEAAPEALTDRRPARVPGAKAHALALWARHREAIAGTLPEADRAAFAKAMEALAPTAGDEAGLAALDAMALLEHRLPEGRPRWLAAADREGMRTWILLGQSRTDLPDLDAAFQPLMAEDGGAHPQAVARTRAELARYHAALGKQERREARKAVSALLDLVDVFEKPGTR